MRKMAVTRAKPRRTADKFSNWTDGRFGVGEKIIVRAQRFIERVDG